MKAIPSESYKYQDLILPILQQRGAIPDPCPIEIRLEPKRIKLFVGPRDWEFDRETGEMTSSGTRLCGPELTAPETTPAAPHTEETP